MKYCKHLIVVAVVILMLGTTASAQEVKQDIKLLINSPDEPLVKQMSFGQDRRVSRSPIEGVDADQEVRHLPHQLPVSAGPRLSSAAT